MPRAPFSMPRRATGSGTILLIIKHPLALPAAVRTQRPRRADSDRRDQNRREKPPGRDSRTDSESEARAPSTSSNEPSGPEMIFDILNTCLPWALY